MTAVPARTVTVVFDGKNFKAIAVCGNCKKISRVVKLVEVPTNAIDGTVILKLDDVNAFDIAMNLIAPTGCECEY